MGNCTRVRRVLASTALDVFTLGFGAMADTAFAQEQPPGEPAARGDPQLEDIIVQARRVSESQQDVPVAITTVSGDRLQDARRHP